MDTTYSQVSNKFILNCDQNEVSVIGQALCLLYGTKEFEGIPFGPQEHSLARQLSIQTLGLLQQYGEKYKK